MFGVSDTRLKERLLRESSDLTLEKAASLCRAAEVSENQLKELNSSETKPVHAVKSKSKQKPWKKPRQQQAFNCKKCGTKHLSKACPPFGRPCLFWKRKLLRQNVSTKESSRPPGRFKQACRQWWKSRVRGIIYRDIDWAREVLKIQLGCPICLSAEQQLNLNWMPELKPTYYHLVFTLNSRTNHHC